MLAKTEAKVARAEIPYDVCFPNNCIINCLRPIDGPIDDHFLYELEA